MKKLLTLTACLFSVLLVHAQPWMPANNNGPLKLADIIANYRAEHPATDDDAVNDKDKTINKTEAEEEGGNYQFDRWVWYWKSHLDSNGYMVSPVITQQEWEASLAQQKQAAKSAKTTGNSSSWSFVGPQHSEGGYYGLGRINAIAFHPTDSNTFYIGSAGGGAWKTTDNGMSWAPLYSNIATLGVSDIAVNPLNPNVMYICTGDGDGGDTYSIGIIKTTDGGITWSNTGLVYPQTQYVSINAITINPLDTSVIMVASTLGIYKSVNSGATWLNKYGGTFKKVLYNPADTNILYASGNNNYAQVYRSVNGGNTWQPVTSIPGINNGGRVSIAVTPANPAIVKAVASNNIYGLEGIYSSSDSGATFTKIFYDTDCSNNILANSPNPSSSNCDGQGWYDLPIAISPLDSNLVLVGGVNTWSSLDGGNTWQIANQWLGSLPGIQTVHADKHVYKYNPLTPTALFEGNDGGVYRTLNPNSELWTDLTNGLGITQFYRNAVDNNVTFAIGGAQDNGCKMVNGNVATELTGGDGMQCQIDYSDPANTFYTESQYGSINRTTNGGASFSNIANNIPGNHTGDWITPFVIHPTTPNILLAGYKQLFYTANKGNTWDSLSPYFPALVNDSSLFIDRIQIAPSNPNYIYVLISQYGNGGSTYLYCTTDFGTTWHSITTTFTGTMSDIKVDPKNENILWVTYSGYGFYRASKYNKATNIWTTANTGLPDIPVNCILVDSSNGTLYVGTDVAVYFRDTAMTTWALYNNNLPSVTVNDLNINYTTGELWAATFGRGMWKTTKQQDTIPNTSISIIPLASGIITAAPNPSKGSFTVSTSNTSFFGKAVTVRLITADGKTAWQANTAFDNNGNIKVNAAGMAKGVYICDVVGDNILARVRIVVL